MNNGSRVDRRQFLATSALAWLPAKANAQHANLGLITKKADESIDLGLDYLAKRQNDDGSLGTSVQSRDVGVCSLAGMAFLASGSVPGRGRFGGQVAQCLNYVLSHCDRNGFIQIPGLNANRPMYGQGFGSLFMAECFGMSRQTDHREKLGKAIRLIINSQSNEGGWRYLPQRKDSDLSVTVCQVMALRAAKDAGIFVAKSTMDKAIDYLYRCQNRDGGFRYQQENTPSTFSRTAAAIVGLYSAGIYDGPVIDLGLKYLSQFHPGNGRSPDQYFFYGHYYAALAMWQVGDATWKNWYQGIRDQLIELQDHRDGSWQNEVWSREYGTALATIILQVPNDLVPIFQR